MDKIKLIRTISLWVFIVPFVSINVCLIIVTQFHEFLEMGVSLGPFFPYLDGGASISRTVRNYPLSLIFKPAMFLTSYLLIRYWYLNKNLIIKLNQDHKHLKKIIFFGISSAIALSIHSIFLGIKFEYDLYKLFRRVILLAFIIFEIIAQAYLVIIFYSIKDKLNQYINPKILKLKLILVSTLCVVAIISIPIISVPGDYFLGMNLKFFKHALEWDYFIGVISFYLLTFFMWKKVRP